MRYAIALLLLASSAQAGPYFRLLDINNVQRSAGAYVDPFNPSNTSAGTAIALITHSTKDGCAFPSIVCEDWSPLTAGFSANAGRLQFNLGPVVNVAPLVKAGAKAILDQVTNEDSLLGVKSVLGSEPIGGSTPSIAFGPALAVTPIQHGVILPIEKWQGKLRIFAGAAWRFK